MFIHIPGMDFRKELHLRAAALDNSGCWLSSTERWRSQVPQKRLSMRKIRDVLRLRFGLNLGQDQIARSCSIGQATVHRYLERSLAAGLTWPLPDHYDDRRLNELLFPSRPDYPPSVRFRCEVGTRGDRHRLLPYQDTARPNFATEPHFASIFP